MHDEFTPSDYRVVDMGYDTPCWIWQHAKHRLGYGVLHRTSHTTKFAHIAYYVDRFGPVPEGQELDHLCRNRDCVNPDHLEPVTHTENMRRASCTLLTMEDARAIRASYGKIPGAELGRRYGVSRSTISKIMRNINWHDPDFDPGNRFVSRHRAKLTWQDVDEIRAATDERTRDLANRYGVSQSVISEIRNHKTWKRDPAA